MKYSDMTDAELVCEYRHGWTSKGYIGRGVSDRAYEAEKVIQEHLLSRNIDPQKLSREWGVHDKNCPFPH